MRLILLHDLDVARGWANGTRLRLLPAEAWTGKPKKLRRSSAKAGQWEADQVHLQDVRKHPEFNLKVIKDEECTLARQVRFSAFDVQTVPAREDVSRTFRGIEVRWKQVQATLAYALTAHKAQGLTMDTVYLCVIRLFGFGLPYTMCTRSPWLDNI